MRLLRIANVQSDYANAQNKPRRSRDFLKNGCFAREPMNCTKHGEEEAATISMTGS